MKHQQVFIRSLYIYLMPHKFNMKIYYALIFFTFKSNSMLKNSPHPQVRLSSIQISKTNSILILHFYIKLWNANMILVYIFGSDMARSPTPGPLYHLGRCGSLKRTWLTCKKGKKHVMIMSGSVDDTVDL